MKVKYRLDLDFYSVPQENAACETSSPIYSLEEGFRKYFNAIDNDKCVDNEEIPVRAHLWEYHYTRSGELNPKTLAKNY